MHNIAIKVTSKTWTNNVTIICPTVQAFTAIRETWEPRNGFAFTIAKERLQNRPSVSVRRCLYRGITSATHARISVTLWTGLRPRLSPSCMHTLSGLNAALITKEHREGRVGTRTKTFRLSYNVGSLSGRIEADSNIVECQRRMNNAKRPIC